MALVKCSICHKDFMNPSEYHNYECSEPEKCSKYSDVLTQFENLGVQSTFAIVGAPESGKSYYIYSLLYQLIDNPDDTLRDYLRRLDMDVELIGANSYSQYEKFKTILLSEQLQGTVKAAEENNVPIILFMKIGRGRNQKVVKLSFFDLAGEHFTSRDFMQSDPRVFKAKGVLFLMDPFQDPKLNSYLQNQAYSHASPENFKILDDLYHAIRNNDSRRRKKVNIPLAFCLSMFDLLEHLIPEMITQMPYLEIDDLITSRHQYDRNRTINSTREFKRFLGEYSRISPRSMEDKFSNHAIFAFSAIGHDNVQNIDAQGVKSRGIIAPLLWLLAETGFIPIQHY